VENKQTEDLEKDIVSFEKAIELCTLGFDKQTLCGYDIADRQLYLCQVDEDGIYMPQKDLAAPTKSQVFRWFREKYGYIFPISDGLTRVFVGRFIWMDGEYESYFTKDFKTYEEAENACIDKLIELAKQK
jgi:hypothetical protein